MNGMYQYLTWLLQTKKRKNLGYESSQLMLEASVWTCWERGTGIPAPALEAGVGPGLRPAPSACPAVLRPVCGYKETVTGWGNGLWGHEGQPSPGKVNGYVHRDFWDASLWQYYSQEIITFILASLLKPAVSAVIISGLLPWCCFILFCIWAQSAVNHVTLEEVITSP